MKTLIFFALPLIAIQTFAASIGPQGRKSNYYYYELVPKEKSVLTFQADKICANDTDKISVEEFESTAAWFHQE